MNLQNKIYEELACERIPVTLFMMNGFQIRGVITDYDSFVIVLVVDGKQKIIYKHGISTIAPMCPLKAVASN